MELEKGISEKIDNWKKKQGWDCVDPFTHNTDVTLFTGFDDMLTKIYMFIDMGQNYAAVYGDYGFGKTMMLRKIKHDLTWKYNIIYFEEPVTRDAIYAEILKACRVGFIGRLLKKTPKIKDYEKMGSLVDKRVVLIFDEAHSLSDETFSYLRSLSENGKNFSIIFGGKPDLVALESEKRMPQYLIDRLKLGMPMRAMSETEAVDLIRRRVKLLAKSEKYLFTDEAIKFLAHKSKYIPREILENASSFVEYAIERDLHRIDDEAVERKFFYVTRKEHEPSRTYTIMSQEAKNEAIDRGLFLKQLSPLQTRIIELLFKRGSLSTPEISTELDEDGATIRHMMHRLQGKYDEVKLRPKISHLYPLVIGENIKGIRGNTFTLTAQTRKMLSTD